MSRYHNSIEWRTVYAYNYFNGLGDITQVEAWDESLEAWNGALTAQHSTLAGAMDLAHHNVEDMLSVRRMEYMLKQTLDTGSKL